MGALAICVVYCLDKIPQKKQEPQLSDFYFDYIPDGFAVASDDSDTNSIVKRYEKGEEYIQICIDPLYFQSNIDTENADVNEIYIKSNKGMTVEKDTFNGLVWADEYKQYQILGNIEIDEIIKIGENIKYE